ncbi:MAG: hypothetical protein P4L82_11740 [Ancalomicrobiaceae bacterium]|nr:hypothetical protein [Ancalomicrobiaceae bacterium]
MPDPVIRSRPRVEETTRGSAYAEQQRGRVVREAENDPLDELARMVSEAVGSPVRGTERQAADRTPYPEPNPQRREFPRRDTSWRDPQAPTAVRSSLKPQTMPGQLDDLEAELFSELRGATGDGRGRTGEGRGRVEPRMRDEDPREAPTQTIQPRREVRDDTRPTRPPEPQVRASDAGRQDIGRQEVGRQDTAGRQDMGRQQVGRQDVGRKDAGRQEVAMDDDVTMPMSAVLRQPPGRVPTAPEPATYARPEDSHYDYDPAGAFADEPYAEPAAAHAPDAYAQSAYPQSAYAQSDYAQNGYGYEEDSSAYPNAEFTAPPRPPTIRPARSGSSFMTIAAVAIGVIVIGAAGAYGYRVFVSGGATGNSLPLIKADTKPMKEIPPARPIVASGPNLDVARSEDPSKLVTRQEDPVDQIPGKAQVRLIGPSGQTLPAAAAPMQKVHTVIVRPDGTIVSPEPEAPAVRPPAPSPVKTTSLAPADVAPAAPPPAAVSEPLPLPVEPQHAVLPAPSKSVQPIPMAKPPAAPAAQPKPTITATPLSPNAPRLAKPAPAPVSADNGPLQLGPGPAEPVHVASTAPAPAAPARSLTTDAGGAEWMVAISSHRSDTEARRALIDLERKFAPLGVKGGDVQQAELGARGTYYRARLAGGSKDQAGTLCSHIKAQGVDCWILKR